MKALFVLCILSAFVFAAPLYQGPHGEGEMLRNSLAEEVATLPVAAMVDEGQVGPIQKDKIIISGKAYGKEISGYDPSVTTGDNPQKSCNDPLLTCYTHQEQIDYQQAARTSAPLCPDQPFFGESSFSTCTAFLVAPRVLVTAGHCLGKNLVEAERNCRQKKWIFGLAGEVDKKNPDRPTLAVEQKQVAQCDRLFSYSNRQDQSGSSFDQTHQDYAVIILKEAVPERAPFLTDGRAVSRHQALFMYGHPMGLTMKSSNIPLPQKQTPQAGLPGRISAMSRPEGNTFWANVDQFPGNSGSPILSRDRQGRPVVRGILSEGSVFHYMLSRDKTPPCMEAIRCYDENPEYKKKIDYLKRRFSNLCQGERATYMDKNLVPLPTEEDLNPAPIVTPAPQSLEDEPRKGASAPTEDDEVWGPSPAPTRRR